MTKADLQAFMDFCRNKTEGLIDTLAKQDDVNVILGWRPGPARAHIAWQLMHIGATDDRHLNIRMNGGEPVNPEYVRRFAGGSTPDDDIPDIGEIREYVNNRRQDLLKHLQSLNDDQLSGKPNEQAPWIYSEWFQLLAWHEAHHQGQAHLTHNLYKANHPQSI